MASEYVNRRMLTIGSILFLCALILAIIAFWAEPVQGANETSDSLDSLVPEPDPAGSADWPMPLYDSGRTRANLQEIEFSAPFNPTPAYSLTYDVGGAMRPAAVTANDMLFWYKTNENAGGDELVVATDLDGQKLWSFDIPDGYNLRSTPPVVAGEEVFVAEYGDSYHVVALDRQTGIFLWRRPIYISTLNQRASLPIAVQGGVVYLSWWQDSVFNGFLTAVDARTGAIVWDITPDNNGALTAEALAITNDVLIALHNDHIVGYDLSNGSELWEFDVSAVTGGSYLVEDMVAVGGIVAFANTRILGALDVTNGSVIWSELIDTVSCDPYADSALASDGDDLFIMGVCRDQLRKYDLDTGIELWRETIDQTEGHIAFANNVVYVNALDQENDTEFISAHAADSGQFLQRIDASAIVDEVGFGFIPHVQYFAVANGQLMAVVPGTTAATRYKGTLFFWGGGANFGYLPLFNDDSSPDTNPNATAEVSIIDRDGTFGARIKVAASIGSLSATLKIYHDSGQLYKEAVGNPDAFGNGFWVAPLEYATAGYQYQVILSDGMELPLRNVVMPADPASNISFEVQTNSLNWQSAPALLTTEPYTLTLSLPGGFPPITTTSFAFLQSPGRGTLTIPGIRLADEILFLLNHDTVVNGDFTITAMATAGKLTSFSSDLNVSINVPTLPDVSVQGFTTIEPSIDGSATAVNFNFERRRPLVDPLMQADVQIASIVPDPAGYQVTLWVKTPAEVPFNPITSKWEVGIVAYDTDGNELNRATTEIPSAPQGRYIVMAVTQPGSIPIATLGALGASLENTAAEILTVIPKPLNQANQVGIHDQPDGDDDNNNPTGKRLKITDIIDVNLKGGGKVEMAAGGGIGGSKYLQASFISEQVQVCEEAGPRIGAEAALGPEIELNATVDVRGPNHDASASNGTEYSISGGLIYGVKVFYQRPDNIEDTGLGTFGVGITAAPEAGFSIAANQYRCVPAPWKQPKTKPPAPGNEHPDDTESIVLQNDNFSEVQTYWRGIFAYANSQGFSELVDYARYRLQDLSYIETISTFPIGIPLSHNQVRILRAYESNRILTTAAMNPQWKTISAQLDRLEALQANVLANGYYEEMRSLLFFYGIPNQLIPPDFSPDALTGSTIIIPTAGFYGLETDDVFAGRLERFVSQGGTLVVMTQPGDQSIDLLPGSWSQVDYQQDISCYIDAMTVVDFQPFMASIAESTFTSHVDGFMTVVPNTAQLLMERTKNQQGAFVYYEYGQGRMIVTNMYDDWGRTVGQSSVKVRNLFRDIMRWGSIGAQELLEVGPNQGVELSVEVENVTFQDSSKIQWVVRDPNGLEVESGLAVQDLTQVAGQSSQEIVNFTPGDITLGIWSLNYQLLDNAEEVVQGETQGGYFIVKDPPAFDLASEQTPAAVPYTPGATDIEVSLNLDQAAYQPGENVSVTLAISLTDPGAVSGLKAAVSLGDTSQEQLLPALANQQVTFNLPADFDGNGLLFYGVYESDAGQGLYLNTLWVQPAGDNITIVPAAPSYTPGQTVTLNISGDYTRTIFVDAADFARTLEVSATATVTFELPTVLSSGPVKVQYFDSGFQRTARFDVIGPRVTVKDMDTNQPLIAPGAQANIYATIESDQALDVLIAGEIVDGDGFRFPTVYMTTTLSPGQQTLTMTMPISTSTSGSVRYQMEIFDGTKTAVSYVQAHRFFTIDAPALQAARAAGGPTTPANKPQVSLDWYAPSAAELNVTLWLDGNAVVTQTVNLPGGFTTTDLTIPGELAPGVHELYAEAQVSDGITTSVHGTLTVIEASLNAIYLPMVTR